MSFKTAMRWLLLSVVFSVFHAQGQERALEQFADGPLITGYGKHARVSRPTFLDTAEFSVVFDVAMQADGGEINRKFDSLARFLNMHVAAGVPAKNLNLALVVHGRASKDLLDHQAYTKAHQQENPNKGLLLELIKNNVRVILCGQSAAAYQISQSQLIEGVEIELSAMTAHALLQQQGYSVNPF